MLEEGSSFFIQLDGKFPADDLRKIILKLNKNRSLIPGFVSAPAGFLNLESIIYATFVERVQTVVMPDRNIVSRMAEIARVGMSHPMQATSRLAAEIMALCQSVDFEIEPSIAFHELAHRQGNHEALAELAWFRVADQNQHQTWIDIALGRATKLPTQSPKSELVADLATPLNRWTRNYAVALKIGELELSLLDRRTKARSLMEWMVADFIVAGPAAMFATMYLSPRAAKAGMMKHLRSKDRAKALAGVKNAAWDITYLSEFVRRVKSENYDEKR